MMEIRRFESDLLSSNMYLIVEGNHGIVIDPCRDTAPAAGLVIDYILLTHEHYDHISGVLAWKEATGAMVLCSQACGENIQSPRRNLASTFTVFCELQTWVKLDKLPDADSQFSCHADETFEDETVLTWRGHAFKLFALPGHSLGSIGIILDDRYFFSGDTLIEGVQIALRLPGGSKTRWNTIGAPRLAKLPEGLIVHPGHFDSFIYKRK